jgi:RimJ/RimL family protein N-acetyltransferase
MRDDVTLRDVRDEDEPVFFAQQSDPEAARLAAFPIRAREAHAAHWKKHRADADVRLQTILVDGRVAGNVVSFEREGRRLVGYWIGREFWGRGIASRALALFLEQDRVRPLEAFVAKHNAGSIRVLEKNGFVRVGEDVIPPESAGSDGPVEEWLMRLEA